MKGLLLKDFYMMQKYCRMYVIIVLGFIGLSCLESENLFFVFYPCIFAAMLPVTLLGYDERSRWNEYCGTLPYTRAQIVSGKYWIGSIMQLTIFVLVAVTQAVRMYVMDCVVWSSYFVILALLFIISCVSSSITMPVMFKLGVEKGRIAYTAMIAFGCGGSVAAATVLKESGLSVLQEKLSFSVVLLLLCVLALVGYLFSWWLSIRFYEKREL